MPRKKTNPTASNQALQTNGRQIAIDMLSIALPMDKDDLLRIQAVANVACLVGIINGMTLFERSLLERVFVLAYRGTEEMFARAHKECREPITAEALGNANHPLMELHDNTPPFLEFVRAFVHNAAGEEVQNTNLINKLAAMVRKSRTSLNNRNKRALRRDKLIKEAIGLGISEPQAVFDHIYNTDDRDCLYKTSDGKHWVDPKLMMKTFRQRERKRNNGRNSEQRP